MLMAQEARSLGKKKEDSAGHRSNTKYLVLLVATTESEPRSTMAGLQIVLKNTCEISILVSTQSAELIEVIPCVNVAENYAYITANRILDL